jgi:hypothetical protein
MIKKNLFLEAQTVLSKDRVMAISPYTSELAAKLITVPSDTKEIVDTIVKISGEQEDNVDSSAATQPGFFSFVNAVDEALKKQQPPIFGDYSSETPKLAALVAHAYYLASKKDKSSPEQASPKVYHSFDAAQAASRDIINRMSNDLKLGYLFTKHPEFKKAVGEAACAAVYKEKEKDKAAEATSFQMPPTATPPPQK